MTAVDRWSLTEAKSRRTLQTARVAHVSKVSGIALPNFAVNGAAHLGSKVSGAILTSSVTRAGRAGETVFDAEPGAIAVPVLVVNNEYDTCGETPPSDAPMVLSALTRSPRRELVMVTSSQIVRRSDPCEAMSPHGYLGIEGMVVQRISEWIRAAGGR